MSEGAITTTEEIEELKKKLALLGKTWLIRISLVYKLHKCQRFLELAYWTLQFKHFSTSNFKLIECFSLGFLPLLFIVQRATVFFYSSSMSFMFTFLCRRRPESLLRKFSMDYEEEQRYNQQIKGEK